MDTVRATWLSNVAYSHPHNDDKQDADLYKSVIEKEFMVYNVISIMVSITYSETVRVAVFAEAALSAGSADAKVTQVMPIVL